MYVDEDGTIWFRQSWLEDALRCNERGRRSLVNPEFNQAVGDSALIGTAAHHSIAACLRDDITSIDDCRGAAHDHALQLCEEHVVKWTKFTMPAQLATHAARCAEAWYREIRPSVPEGGAVEVEFAVPLFKCRGRQVGIKGTVDYADPTGVLWDWKTGGKKYEQRSKQRTAIQPTTYCTAAIHGGLGDVAYQYPIKFNFGLMVRGDATSTTQIVTVQRTINHEKWLMDHLRTYMDLADALGVWRSWPRNEDHYLCNPTWCPWWTVCKGARLSDEEEYWRG